MNVFLIMFALHLLAMLIAMMLIRISCNVVGAEHSFGPLGRELAAMTFIALVQLMITAVLILNPRRDGFEGVHFITIFITTGYGFKKTRSWIWDDWISRPRLGLLVFAGLTLICFLVLPLVMKNLR